MEDIEGYGPLMTALTEKQRGYVLAMLADPLGNPTVWARAAGYEDDRRGGRTGLRVTAHRLAHRDDIIEAAREEARRHLNSVGVVMAVGVLLQIARNPKHNRQMDAALALTDRAGFGVKTEHKVTVEHVADDRMLEIARRLAGELGVSEMKLVGGNTAKVVEHEGHGGTNFDNAGGRADGNAEAGSGGKED